MGRSWKPHPQTIVVDFSRGSINMAAAESAGEAVRFRGITQLRLPELEEGKEADHSVIAPLLADEVGRRGWQGMNAACLLSRSATSTQSFLFPPMPDADLRKAIALKLVDTLHFDLDDALFDFRRVRERGVEGSKQVLTLVAVARKDAIEHATGILRRAGLKPIAVGAASESLANLTYYASPCDAEDATVHVDIGSESTILNLFEGRLLRFSREIDTAGESFTRALMRPVITARGPVRLTHAQAADVLAFNGYPQEDRDVDLPYRVRSSDVLPLVEPVAQRLTAEIRQSANYLANILSRPKIDYVVLSGSGAQMRGLDAQLEENLDAPVVSIDPVARAIAHWRLAICDETPESVVEFSAILGYSLGPHRPLNLMPRELRDHKANVTRTRKALVPPALLVGAGLSLAAIPIQRRFNEAYDRTAAVSERLSERLDGDLALRKGLAQALESARRVSVTRGPIPNWTGILKELSSAFPAEAYIVSISEERQEGSGTLELVARIERGETPFEAFITRLTATLGTSPFFGSVRVLEATSPSANQPGELVLSLEIAGHPEAWRPDR